eukprot:Tamp_22204.p1 GENE.Tamp_22204~~Tamp_22204.p1  ORF type:complete len:155 (-),score=4.79 Tamp_22204:285-749(-)
MLQRPFFFAFWPQYYITAKPAHELGPATASTVQWPPHNMSRMESPLADSKAGGHSHSHAGKWRDARRLDQLDGLDGLDAQCHDIPVFLPGLGVSASGWWGRLNPLTSRPVAFHYLQPRALRLLDKFFTECLHSPHSCLSSSSDSLSHEEEIGQR